MNIGASCRERSRSLYSRQLTASSARTVPNFCTTFSTSLSASSVRYASHRNVAARPRRAVNSASVNLAVLHSVRLDQSRIEEVLLLSYFYQYNRYKYFIKINLKTTEKRRCVEKEYCRDSLVLRKR